MVYFFPSFPSQTICVLDSKVSLVIAYSWIDLSCDSDVFSLSIFQDGDLPCDFGSPMGPRKAIDSQLAQLFSYCEDSSDYLQCVYM